MNKIFQLLLVVYLAFYFTDSWNDESKGASVRGSMNATSANNATAEIGALKIKRDIAKEIVPLPSFATETVGILNSNKAIPRFYYRKEGVASTFNFEVPIHLRVN